MIHIRSKHLAFSLAIFLSSCTNPFGDSLDTEARKLAMQYFESNGLIECKGDYFVYSRDDLSYGNDWWIHQLKKPEIVVKQDMLSDADKLNGIEWRSNVSITAEIMRICHPTGCQKWENAGSMPLYLLQITNTNGQITMDHNPFLQLLNHARKEKNCEALLKLIRS